MKDQKMLYLNGTRISCSECGANVFHPHESLPDIYVCNGCSSKYWAKLEVRSDQEVAGAKTAEKEE